MKRKVIAVFLAVTILGLTGCQKNPESSIVKNKDLDNMLEAAQNSEEGTDKVEEMAGNYDTYQTTVTDKTLNVTVNVDARVDIPNADKMSIVRMQSREISQEFLDKVRETLAPEVVFYEGRILQEETKEECEELIRSWKKEMDSIDPSDEETMKEYQEHLDSLQERYENALKKKVLTDYPSDRKLHTVQEYVDQYPDSEYYKWQAELNRTGSVYYGESDVSKGERVALYVQNNENFGNCIRYQKGESTSRVDAIGQFSCLEWDKAGLWKASETPNENNTHITFLNVPSLDVSKMSKVETAELSMEEAKERADGLLEKLGLTEYGYFDGDKYCEFTEADAPTCNEDIKYREEYVFQYLRNQDGVLVNNIGEEKRKEEGSGETYQQKVWVGERVVVYVNDNGIVGFQYIAPLEIGETLVDKANMKTFEEVKDVFEQMIVVTKAEDLTQVEVDVDRVILRYMRISEEDSFDTGLLVPVWDFMGTVHKTVGERTYMEPYQSVLTINAIDGSVINKEVGY